MKPIVVNVGVWVVAGALVLFAAGFIVPSALKQRLRWHDSAAVTTVTTPISPQAEQQALDRTAKRLFAMDDCAQLGVCGRNTFDDPIRTIEQVWSRGQVLYVQVRPAPWREAPEDRREHAVDQIMGIWVQELLTAGIWRFSDRDNTRIIVLDKEQTLIICGGGKIDPKDPQAFYSCRGLAIRPVEGAPSSRGNSEQRRSPHI